jgi:hypothetical protein
MRHRRLVHLLCPGLEDRARDIEAGENSSPEGSMKLLILGGTVFLGRHLIEAALASDHEVTLFNRA